MSRTTRTLAAAALAALVLSGCGDGSAVRSGAAAVVGDERISTQRLQEIVDAALADPEAAETLGDRQEYQRRVLDNLIQFQLMEVAATRAGVTVTQGQVDEVFTGYEDAAGSPEQLATDAADQGYTLARVREIARFQSLQQALGDRLTADVEVPPEQLQQAFAQYVTEVGQVRVAQIVLATPAAAEALLGTASDTTDEDFAALARSRSTDAASAAAGGDLGLRAQADFAEDPEVGAAAFAGEVGDTVVANGAGGTGVVLRVLERQPSSPAEVETELRRGVLQEQQAALVQEALAGVAADTEIEVNPRFGVWDAAGLTVLERGADVARPFSSPGAPDPDAPDPDAVEPPAADEAPTG